MYVHKPSLFYNSLRNHGFDQSAHNLGTIRMDLPTQTVVREQLGLNLEQVKDQEEVLVVDHVERPSEN
jgi:uncharacterized protein (TIGR03435 family)